MAKVIDWIQPFLEHCRYQRQLSEGSIRNYGIDLRHFVGFLEKADPPIQTCNQVTKRTLEDYLATLSAQYKVKTIKRKLATLHSFFTYLQDQELLEENPFQRFKLRMREGYRQPKSLTIREIDQFLKTVYRDDWSWSATCLLDRLRDSEKPVLHTLTGEFFWFRDIAILELLFAVGLRVAELCNLRYPDYDRAERSLHIIGKGNRERILFIENQQVIKALEDYLYLRRATNVELPYVFITRGREQMSTQGVRNLVAKYAEKAGLEKHVTPHVFRHSFASLLLESGVDIKYIQDFLGHSTISTTQIYLHVSDEQKRRILATSHPRSQMLLNKEPR